MKKFLTAMVMTTITFATTSQAGVIDERLREAKLERQIAREDAALTAVPAPTEQESFTVKWHPTSVVIGAIAGGALVGGVGAVVIGGLVGEVVIRIIKKKQEQTAKETQE